MADIWYKEAALPLFFGLLGHIMQDDYQTRNQAAFAPNGGEICPKMGILPVSIRMVDDHLRCLGQELTKTILVTNVQQV